MPSAAYNTTREALRRYGRGRGPAKQYTTALPLVRVSREMLTAARAMAEFMGVSLAEVARIALAEFLAEPRESAAVNEETAVAP